MTILRNFIPVFTAVFFLSCSDYPPLKFPSEEEFFSKISSSSSIESLSSSSEPSSSSLEPSSSSSEKEIPLSSVGSSSSEAELEPSSSSVDLCADFTEGTKREHYEEFKDQFCDSRDGNKYVYVKIGTQTWMAENLNYDAENSKCTFNMAICAIFGGFYNWEMAKDACPSGWHLPKIDDFDKFLRLEDCRDGKCLIAIGEGNNQSYTDKYGFAALLGGYIFSSSSMAMNVGGYWWTASELDNSDKAYGWVLSSSETRKEFEKSSHFFSVRCLKND
jgi:uncharacterized protein (TIGR02145 family)